MSGWRIGDALVYWDDDDRLQLIMQRFIFEIRLKLLIKGETCCMTCGWLMPRDGGFVCEARGELVWNPINMVCRDWGRSECWKTK